jgi:RimJ/RimL family protein N-acetyltransferase
MMEMAGSKTVLKEFTREHLHDERYFRWLRDIDVAVGIYRVEYLLPLTFQSVEAYVNSVLASGTDCFFAVHDKKTDEFVGTQRIGHIDWRAGTGDIGVLIGAREHWSKGYATDAVRSACRYSFDVLSLRRLTGGTPASNAGMRRCFEKVGFKEEGCRRSHLLIRGRYEDHIVFGLLKEELIEG